MLKSSKRLSGTSRENAALQCVSAPYDAFHRSCQHLQKKGRPFLEVLKNRYNTLDNNLLYFRKRTLSRDRNGSFGPFFSSVISPGGGGLRGGKK
jgi:hypothetical protein